jgi:hypothetical protein
MPPPSPFLEVMRASLHHARLGLAGMTATVATLAGAGTAMAASASVSVTTAAGQSDPVAYIARVFTVAGSGPAGSKLYVRQRPAGGAGCAPTAYADPGRLSTGFYGLAVNGSFSFQRVAAWDAPGDWTFCMWLAPDEMTIAAPIAQTVSFRTPAGQMATSIRPSTPQVGERAQVTLAGDTEAPRRLWAKVRPASAGACGPTYDADPGQSLIEGWDADGAFDAKRYTWPSSPGQYVVCAWLAGESYDPWPIVGPQALSFNVVPRPPVVSSAAALDCRNRRAVKRFRARKVKAVCMRYGFARPPAPGTPMTVSYVTPAHRTYKTMTTRWPSTGSRALNAAPLTARAYANRHGRWRAVLSVSGRRIRTTSFRVM